MQKFSDVLPSEYKQQAEVIYPSIKKPKKKKIGLAISNIILLILIMSGWPIIISPGTYFYPNIVRPEPSILPPIKNIIKKIEINLSVQRLIIWEGQKKIAEYIVSTGKRTTPTKAGNFSVNSKHPMAYGGIEGLTWAMPYFLGIYTAGGQENGIHELPFLNGRRESASSLGYAISHGCVRLPIGKAELVYNWAEIGTPVIIHY